MAHCICIHGMMMKGRAPRAPAFCSHASNFVVTPDLALSTGRSRNVIHMLLTRITPSADCQGCQNLRCQPQYKSAVKCPVLNFNPDKRIRLSFPMRLATPTPPSFFLLLSPEKSLGVGTDSKRIWIHHSNPIQKGS